MTIRADPSAAPLLSVVIPVYNEPEGILATLSALNANFHGPKEVLVVYDRDSDTTLPVLRAHGADFLDMRPQKNLFEPGALNAIRSGFAVARGDAVIVVMADMADDLSALEPMWKAFLAGADVVCGSRYMPGGEQRGGPVLKSWMSRTAGRSLNRLTGIPTQDVTNSFKLYRRSFLDGVHIESRGGFEIGMELTVKAFVSGRQVTEVPSIWTDRTAGSSRFRLIQWLPRYLRWYFFALRRSWFGRRPTGERSKT